MNFKKLKEIRLKNNLTQKQMGDIIGLSFQAINEIEHARRSITLERLLKLSDYFDVSLDWLMGRTDNPQSHKT
jgi:transcriptional regulator with XRE-family HTH domain